jgi:hypothetical protein
MFDKVGQAAERLATHVSRRAFFGRLGQRALATAGALGGMLAFGGKAQAYILWCGGVRCLPGQLCGWNHICYWPGKKHPPH